MPRKGYTYITANKNKTVLYVGATSELKHRIESHKNKKYKSAFSARYNIDKLVYWEEFETIMEALQRERQIKAGSRKKKVDLINSMNPDWEDLYSKL
ncbi:MAG: GIY-YIG nuclease family protein [Bacteroidales bacterium]|nr:GIY-YIG nuclease family protein [Bacteroidales bacterium]